MVGYNFIRLESWNPGFEGQTKYSKMRFASLQASFQKPGLKKLLIFDFSGDSPSLRRHEPGDRMSI
jgi:hypothetical protein